jgi:hypothetical protein
LKIWWSFCNAMQAKNTKCLVTMVQLKCIMMKYLIKLPSIGSDNVRRHLNLIGSHRHEITKSRSSKNERRRDNKEADYFCIQIW